MFAKNAYKCLVSGLAVNDVFFSKGTAHGRGFQTFLLTTKISHLYWTTTHNMHVCEYIICFQRVKLNEGTFESPIEYYYWLAHQKKKKKREKKKSAHANFGNKIPLFSEVILSRFLLRPKKKVCLTTFLPKKLSAMVFFFFFLENEQCETWEFFFCVFLAHFFWGGGHFTANFFQFILLATKKKKTKIGLST